MAPLHHLFELLGVPEAKIVAMYMIITAVLCLLCLLAYV
jgi:phospho-N-acetylmuramoyl-pentapeptide-transferase